MKTDDLITLLSADAAPVDIRQVARRANWLLGLGAAATFLLMMLSMGPRHDLAQAVALPMFWVKLAFPASLAVAALLAVRRLSHPGMRLGQVGTFIGIPVLGVWLAAILVLLDAPASDRLPLALGTSWKECAASIAALSVPALLAAYWAIKGLAPTRLALAGAAAGLFAGATAAAAYALHCTEMELPFLAIWYVLGMALPAALGAILGGRLLRW